MDRGHNYNGDDDVANVMSNQEFVKCETHGFIVNTRTKKLATRIQLFRVWTWASFSQRQCRNLNNRHDDVILNI